MAIDHAPGARGRGTAPDSSRWCARCHRVSEAWPEMWLRSSQAHESWQFCSFTLLQRQAPGAKKTTWVESIKAGGEGND
jgi:hypothetical protein